MSNIFKLKGSGNKGDIVELLKQENTVALAKTKPELSNVKIINSDNSALGLSCVSDLDGNVYVIGQYDKNLFSNNIQLTTDNDDISGIFIAQLGFDNEWKWARSILTFEGALNIQADFDMVYRDGFIYAGGTIMPNFSSSIKNNVFDKTLKSGGFIIKFEQGGTIDYLTTFEGTLGERLRLDVDCKSNVYFTNSYTGRLSLTDDIVLPCMMDTQAVQTNYSAFVAKLDKKGNFEWAKDLSIPDCEENSSIINDIITTKKGKSYVIGTFKGRVLLDDELLKCRNCYTSDTCSDTCLDTSYYTTDCYSSTYTNFTDFTHSSRNSRKYSEKDDFKCNNYYSDSTDYYLTDTKYQTGDTTYQTTDSFLTQEQEPVELGCFLLAEIDKCGNWVRSKYYQDAEGLGIDINSCGDFIISGIKEDNNSCDKDILFVSKLDKKWKTIWKFESKLNIDTLSFRSANLTLDEWDNIYIDGPFVDKMKIGDKILIPRNVNDKFIFKLSDNGSLQWADQLVGVSESPSKQLSVDPFGNIYICTGFDKFVEFKKEKWAHTFYETFCVVKISQEYAKLLGVITEIINEIEVKVEFNGNIDAFQNLKVSRDYHISQDGILIKDDKFPYFGTAISKTVLFKN